MVPRATRKLESILMISLFMPALALPGLGLLFRWHVMTEQEENRRLAPFPSLNLNRTTIEGLPEAFTAYFNDNFGFRPTLVHLQAFTKLRLLGVSSSPVVIAGKNGWLFLAREYSATGQHLVPPYSETQLHDWKVLLE